MPRKRINLSFPPEIDSALDSLAEAYGFRGSTAMATAILEAFTRRVERQRMKEEEEEKDEPPRDEIAEEVREMFSECEEYEPTFTNTHVHVIHKPESSRKKLESSLKKDLPGA